MKKLTREEFIARSLQIEYHRVRNYDYSEVNYIDIETKVVIICPKHGRFLATPHCHIGKHRRGGGCEKCREDGFRKNQEEKICEGCNTKKSHEHYNKNKHYCKECDARINGEKLRKQSFNKRVRCKEKLMLKEAKKRAERDGRDFNITLCDIIIPDVCPVLGIPIFRDCVGLCDNSPTLDRIDNTKGYVKGNVKVISHRANQIKSVGTIDEHLKIVEYMKSTFFR